LKRNSGQKHLLGKVLHASVGLGHTLDEIESKTDQSTENTKPQPKKGWGPGKRCEGDSKGGGGGGGGGGVLDRKGVIGKKGMKESLKRRRHKT